MADIVKKNGINFGIIVGVVSILSSAIIYAVNLELMVNIWLGIVLFLVNLVIGIVAVAKTKKAMGGIISFKQAFSVYFFTMAIGSLIGTLFMYVLFNFVDPAAKETLTQLTVEKTVSMMQGVGAKTEDIRKTAEQIQATDNFSIGSLIKSYFFGLIFSIIIALIVGAAFKNTSKSAE
ncbi:DUF4199 domain-containing protein [Flavobacterium sp. MK4S-17]|jgi:hypothetical protein|uniref:DUF4199 domain-containing protein n=1 Tax=Flavobacterium sp. MK4S-17 TaxID=2543737 RepID=UPI0013597AAE|nr:DUF4199 domain-containing protein [Flavobacterium sp. MK4S-17]